MKEDYRLLPDSSLSLEDGDGRPLKYEQSTRHKFGIGLLSVSLLVSLVGNAFYAHRLDQMRHTSPPAFANLKWDVPVVLNFTSDFDHTDRAIQDAAWASDTARPENFVVALEDSYTEPLGLPHAMRSPWDKSKGVYVLNSGHVLHCLQTLRTAMHQAHDGVAISTPREHNIHCLSFLLHNAMCHADDTPWYSGRLHANLHADPRTLQEGYGSVQMCRSWDRLQSWAAERSACYDDLADRPDAPEFEHYKFCPDGSTPWREQTQ